MCNLTKFQCFKYSLYTEFLLRAPNMESNENMLLKGKQDNIVT